MLTSEPIDQYHFPNSNRTSLATQETSLSLTDETLAEAAYAYDISDKPWPVIAWQRGECSTRGKYGRLFIHEKIVPLEFVRSLLQDRAHVAPSLFEDFNNLPDLAHFEPYEHDGGNWSNRLIKGSGQRVMASLLMDEGLASQVDLVYMDPPYNISFRSNFQGLVNDPSANSTDRWEDLPQDIRQVKAFRDSYNNGVHSYLDQLLVQVRHARELLKDTGSMVMQIGPDNLHFIALLMGEVFGHENHVATIAYKTSSMPSTKLIPEIKNWLIWYAKSKKDVKYRQLYEGGERASRILGMNERYLYWETDGNEPEKLTDKQIGNPELLPFGAKVFDAQPLVSDHESKTGRSEPYIDLEGKKWPCPANKHWRVSHEGLLRIEKMGRMVKTRNALYWKRYEHELPGIELNAMWASAGRIRGKRYVVQTPQQVVERILLMTTDPGDLVLDPTCGSGTTALTAESWGRRWITIDTSAVAVAIARERLATSVHNYYLLKDSRVGHEADHLLECQLNSTPFDFEAKESYGHDPASGFILERQMRVSAGTLAKGPQRKDVIVHPDRAQVDKNRTRVGSSFTVESDLPFRSTNPDTREMHGDKADDSTMRNIEQALQVSGIETSEGGARVNYRITDLTRTPDIPDVTHVGQITVGDGDRLEVVLYVCDVDEVGGTYQLRNLSAAARNRRTPYACLIAFSHEGETSALVEQQGNIRVIKVMANKDLMIPDLEHQRSDSAFFVISEPEIIVHREDAGKFSLEVTGLTVYNPVAGKVEPTDDRQIVAMMTDTDYDHESFKVRLMNILHSTKAGEKGLEKLMEAIDKQVDKWAWDRMKSARTVPFSSPGKGGKVAVKVIDHIGMEHTKVLNAEAFTSPDD
ncbi:MAG: site-specific DNA-methyltransferase [Bacteroidetes bacterium]|nr:site-specific DNA-methyltransferase [Bacteroidota bacterium]